MHKDTCSLQQPVLRKGKWENAILKLVRPTKKSGLAWGHPTKSEPAMGVAAVPPAGHSTAPLDSRAPEPQDQSLHLAGPPLLDTRGWDRHRGGWGGPRQELSAAPKNSVGENRKQKVQANREMLSELSGKPGLAWGGGGSHTLQQYYSSREASPWKELAGEAGVRAGWGGVA